MDNEEVETLVRVMLHRGQQSASAAKVVRAVAAGNDYMSALIITVPRTIQMVDRLNKAPRRQSKRKRRAGEQQQ